MYGPQSLHTALCTLVDSLNQEREGVMGDGASDATDAAKLVRKCLSIVFFQLKYLSLFTLRVSPAARGDQLALEVGVEYLDGGLGEEGGREGVGLAEEIDKHLQKVLQ